MELLLLVKPYLPNCCAVPLRASTSSAAPSAGRQIAADRSFLQSDGGNYIKALKRQQRENKPWAYPDFGALSTSRTPCSSSSSAA
jgi:hypothetical protein